MTTWLKSKLYLWKACRFRPRFFEATWVSPNEPDRTPLTPVAGGGGPGYGGWGLDAGRPRGTGGPSRFAPEKGWSTVFGEEHNGGVTSWLHETNVTKKKFLQVNRKSLTSISALNIFIPIDQSDVLSTISRENADMAAHFPDHIAQILAKRTFDSFDPFSQAFWMTIAEDPVYSQQFIDSQLNRIKKGWPLHAPFAETARGLRSYQICHLDPPEFGGAMYEADNLRMMSALQYALSSEVTWRDFMSSAGISAQQPDLP